MESQIKLVVMDAEPVFQAGIQFMLNRDEQLRRQFTVKQSTITTFEDGLAAVVDQSPNIILLDVNLPTAYNNPAPINLIQAVTRLKQLSKAPIILLYSAPAMPTATLLLLKRRTVL